MDAFTQGYIAALYFTEDTDTPLSAATQELILAHCATFQANNRDALAMYYKSGATPTQAGHDFWLTRNAHGAGFWDRGLGRLGDNLTDAAAAWGGFHLYEHNGELHA